MIKKESDTMDKVEAMLNKINKDLSTIANDAMIEYGLYEKWHTLPINMYAFDPSEYLEYLLGEINSDYELAFSRFANDEKKIMQTVPYFDLDTNKILEIDFITHVHMIAYLMANYGTLRLEEYMHEACKHEIGHMIDNLIELDGKDADVRLAYFEKMNDEYTSFNDWYAAQTSETTTTAEGRMAYYKLPHEQRANEYGHVDADLLFEILKDFDKFDEAYNERE
jgi:hypothetical protein